MILDYRILQSNRGTALIYRKNFDNSRHITFELTEKILILALPLIFLVSFISRDLIVKARTRQRVRAAEAVVFHRIVFQEEGFLLRTHGTRYEEYKETAGRYLPRILNKRS